MAIIESKGSWNLHDILDHHRNRWAAEVSDLQANPSDKQCPVCGRPIQFGYAAFQMAPFKNRDMDIEYWRGFCACRTELIIFND